MSRKTMHVRSNASGNWEVVSSKSSQVYSTKERAVTEARSQAKPEKVIVRNSSGQIIRQADVKTSRSKSDIREAVYAAAMAQRK